MTTCAFVHSRILSCTGLVVPPALWAVNTQLGQVLPYIECGAPLNWAALCSFPAVALSLAAGFVSWRVTRRNDRDAAWAITPYPVSFAFIGALGGLAGAIFAFALVLQGLSSLVLTGCER